MTMARECRDTRGGQVIVELVDALVKQTCEEAVHIIREMAQSELGVACGHTLTEAAERVQALGAVRSCNRHVDCTRAEQQERQRMRSQFLPYHFHCRDESCEDCFGY